jgi:hypothetical protein
MSTSVVSVFVVDQDDTSKRIKMFDLSLNQWLWLKTMPLGMVSEQLATGETCWRDIFDGLWMIQEHS